MPRGKKNKGNSGSAPPPSNNNKPKLPNEPKAPDAIIIAAPEEPTTAESGKSNDDLKVRLANAKERLNLLQEVIGGIGDPTDVKNFEASGIDEAKEKLTIIQDSVNAVKTTLLEVRQDAARSVTPEGSTGGTHKRRKNKKHHNQNPPQGFVARETSASVDNEKDKLTKDAGRNESAEELGDGTSTISKKKRNRNKKNKSQQEQLKSDEPESESKTPELIAKVEEQQPAKICESNSESKENSPESSKSKNKKNKKKGQQNQKDDSKESNPTILDAAQIVPAPQKNDIKVTEAEKDETKNEVEQITATKTPEQQTTKGNLDEKNQKNKNKKKKGDGNDKSENKTEVLPKVLEAKDIPTGDPKDISNNKVVGGENKETKPNDKSTDKGSETKRTDELKESGEGQSTETVKEDPPKKQAEREPDQVSQSQKNKKDKKKGANIVDTAPQQSISSPEAEKQTDLTENILLQQIVEPIVESISTERIVEEEKQDTKSKPSESPKCDSGKHKKDKKKGQTTDIKLSADDKVEEKPVEQKEELREQPSQCTAGTSSIEPIIADVVEQKPESSEIVLQSTKQESHKNKKEKKKGQTTDPIPAIAKVESQAEKTENVLAQNTLEQVVSTAQIVVEPPKQIQEPKNEADCLKTAPQKNKKDKNKPGTNPKSSEKEQEKSFVELPPKLDNKKIETEPIVADVLEQKIETSKQKAESAKEESSTIVQEIKDIVPSLEIVPKCDEKLEAASPPDQIKSKIKTENNETTTKVVKPLELPVPTDEPKKLDAEETKLASITLPSLPKLDFSQVVKENKEKIPLMELTKASPVGTVDGKVEIQEVTEVMVTPLVDVPVPTTDCLSQIKPAVEEPSAAPKQIKAKTPERKDNQKNEQKKQCPQQGKGQGVKPKNEDQKSQCLKKEETSKATVEKVTVKSDPISAEISVPPKPIEAKPYEESTKDQLSNNKKNEKEQLQPKAVEKKTGKTSAEPQVSPKEDVKVEIKPEEVVKPKPALLVEPIVEQQRISDEKMEKDSNKKTIESVPVPDGSATQDKITKPNPPKSTSPRQPEQSKPDLKAETTKRDQKKQNKMKGKAPQPPDIPMDMSLLSASMIDTPTMNQIVSNQETEDQSSLITSDSKNVEGSDFVQSVDSSLNTAAADGARSLEVSAATTVNQNKITEVIRETKNSSPTSDKRNKDEANLRQSDEMHESKRQELPEKSAQQKLEPVQSSVKLMDILDAKMTSPTVKPGNVAGNVRKLPKDAKKPDQAKVQQNAQSKSPKVNVEQKQVKNINLVTGDSSALPAQNSKKDSANTDVKPSSTPATKGKQEIKESTKSDENSTAIDNKPGIEPTIITVAKTKQVDNLKESDVQCKHIDESLPENLTKETETKLQKSNADEKTQDVKVPVGGKDQNANKKPTTKPKVPPKPDVTPKSLPKTTDRSKKSPPKLSENKSSQSKSPVQSPTPTTSTKSSSPNKNTDRSNTKKPEIPPKPLNIPKTNSNKISPISSPDEEEEFVEYKFTPRPVFISTICQVCKVPLETFNPCKLCQMVSYCSDEHINEDQITHGPLCSAIQEIAKKRGGHIYNNARILNDDDYRSLRVHTLNLCESFLKRHLLPFEREILLFPRLCCTSACREWRQQSLIECKQCGQVSYCEAHPEHLPQLHGKWCKSFNLYQKIVLRQKNFGRIEPSLPSKIMLKPFELPGNIDDVFKTLYKNYGAIKDECIYATLTQLATAPLTTFYASQQNQQEIGEIYTVHLVGAELQFEADTLDKWETFFLHLVPSLVEFRVVFVGPELNAENLPLEILSRIRMCRTCRQNCRIVKFDFQCGVLYHEYVKSSAFTKPDLICFFNPGLYRSTGFNGLDTWPNTIKSATLMKCPIVVTSYTEVESPRDLERIQKESERPLTIVQPPHVNPYASQRPERNFISDEIAPMIFKNFYCFCVK